MRFYGEEYKFVNTRDSLIFIKMEHKFKDITLTLAVKPYKNKSKLNNRADYETLITQKYTTLADKFTKKFESMLSCFYINHI